MACSSVYPGAIPSYTTKVDKVDLVDDDHMNQVQCDIVALATELGTDPAGTEVDIKTRLFVCIDDDGAIRKGTAFPSSPKEGQLFYRTDQDILYVYDGTAWDSVAVPGDGTITQAKLNTATGSASTGDSSTNSATASLNNSGTKTLGISIVDHSGTSSNNTTLPGGQYSFTPELANVAGGYQGSARKAQADNRYVTASGFDSWFFLLLDDQGAVQAMWFADDHPSYGQPGDENDIPHPFIDYWDKPLPQDWEIVLVDKNSTKEIRDKREWKLKVNGQPLTQEDINAGRAIMTRGPREILEEEYEVDRSMEEAYVPLDIADQFGNHKYITTLPVGIKVRKLKLL